MYKVIAMTDSQKYEVLWAKFCSLADKGAAILSQYGSLHSCPIAKVRKYVHLGRQQESVQQEINTLFKINQSRISN